MAINQVARAKSLAYTAVGGQNPAPPSGPISNIQSYSFSESQELAEFLLGTSRVNSHYAGISTATIQIETADIAKWQALKVGQKFTNVILRLEGAKDSARADVGDDITITLSQAVLVEKGELSMGNENSAPAVGSLTFALSRHASESADPTCTIAAA